MENIFVDIGMKLHVRLWQREKTPFLLVHGLSSNSLMWSLVAEKLADAGHYVAAVDLRGHGLSDKPATGYDFKTITADLRRLANQLQLDSPIVVGQSWGGNIVLEFGVHYPGVAHGLGMVDGGFIHVRAQPNGADWDTLYEAIKPPDLTGTPYEDMRARLVNKHPDWSDAAVDAFMGNFERLPDGTIRAWLSPDHHRQILRALWEQDPPALYPQIQDPVLLCAAAKGETTGIEYAREWVPIAERSIPTVDVHWFEDSDHDIHTHHPDELAALFLKAFTDGVWQEH